MTYEEAIYFEHLLRTVSEDPQQVRFTDALLGGIISRNRMFGEQQIAQALAEPIPNTPGAAIAYLVRRFHDHENAKRLALNWANFRVNQGHGRSVDVRIDHGFDEELVAVIDAVVNAPTSELPEMVRAFARDNPRYVEQSYKGKVVGTCDIGVA